MIGVGDTEGEQSLGTATHETPTVSDTLRHDRS
jgi:hypothetical protein